MKNVLLLHMLINMVLHSFCQYPVPVYVNVLMQKITTTIVQEDQVIHTYKGNARCLLIALSKELRMYYVT